MAALLDHHARFNTLRMAEECVGTRAESGMLIFLVLGMFGVPQYRGCCCTTVIMRLHRVVTQAITTIDGENH